MTTTEEYMRRFLVADSGISDVVALRVGYNQVPQEDEGDYIFFQQQGATDDAALDDSPGVPTRARYAIESWCDTPARAVSLKNLIQAKLNKYRGTFGDINASTTVKGIFAEDVDDNYELMGDGSDGRKFGSALFAEVVL